MLVSLLASARLLNTKVIRAPGPAHLSPGEHLDFTAVELAAFKLAAADTSPPPTCRAALGHCGAASNVPQCRVVASRAPFVAAGASSCLNSFDFVHKVQMKKI